MAGYLIAEEGPLSGLIVRFEQGTEWVLGRDPDVASQVLEDPMVSRRHVICTLTPEGFLLENLSSVNPATQNGKVIAEAVLLREGDIIQVGSTFFRFTEKDPSLHEEKAPTLFENPEELAAVHLRSSAEARWVLKVITGPNAGGEFGVQRGASYLMGKDASSCDIVFQDLSVSRQHAKLSVDEQENVFIEDLSSRNGVLVNGELISGKRLLASQDLVALGTTSFLLIDRTQARETIISPPSMPTAKPEAPEEVKPEVAEVLPAKDWKEMVIPKRHLIIAGAFALLLLLGIFAMLSLFQSEELPPPAKNESEQIREAIKGYSDIQYSFNPQTGKLFLVGHVLTAVEKQELTYKLNQLPFVQNIESNVVIDELVWQNINALLVTNPDWQGITIQASTPGHFVMRGYLQTLDQAQALSDYINRNFPYLDRLENQVVVESNLKTEIQGLLVEKGFSGVTFELSNGELVLAGRVDEEQTSSFNELVTQLKGVRGIRVVKNFVIYTSAVSSRIDLSDKYKVTGYSRRDDNGFYVVINGKILSIGETLDGMTITAIEPNVVLLEKDGLKFKINYNLQ